MPTTNGSTRVLWELPDPSRAIASRIGMTGDYLPAGMSMENGSWAELSASVAPLFQGVDVTMCNLECPLDTDGLTAMPIGGLGSLVSAHADALDFLPTGIHHVLSVANNHTYNYGTEGAQRTLLEIRRRGMTPLGSECTLREPPAVAVLTSPGGLKLGFWAAANITREPATATVKGVDVATFERGLEALQEMKKQGASFCAALLHAGLMRTDYPDPDDVRLMDRLAQAGFDMVGACHSHRVSGYKVVPRSAGEIAFCFYGLGTLAWNYFASSREREGLLPVAFLDRQGKVARLEIRLIWLDDKGRPTVPDAATSARIFQRLEAISTAIENGSYRRQFYKDMSPDLVKNQLRDTVAAYRDTGMKGIVDKLTRLRIRHIRRLVHKVANL